jgi:hypothetical protein
LIYGVFIVTSLILASLREFELVIVEILVAENVGILCLAETNMGCLARTDNVIEGNKPENVAATG